MRKNLLLLSSLLLSSVSYSAEVLQTISVESSTIDEKNELIKNEVSSSAVITSKEVEKINPQSVSEVLNKIPGITYSLTGTDTLKVHIRGVDNQRYMGEKPGVAIVIDGVPVQETSGKINVDLDNIESIKVIKGGASYLYGNDAIGGAVIITTKRPKGESSSKIEMEKGSFNSNRISVSTNQAFENGSLQLQSSLRDSDGYWDDAYTKVKSINGKYLYFINDESDLTFGIDYTKRQTGDGNSVSGTTMAITDPKSTSQYSYSGYYDTTLIKTFLTYSNDISDDSNLMLRVHSYKDDKEYKTVRATKDKNEIWSQNGLKGEYKKTFSNFAFMTGFDLQRNNTNEEREIIATKVIDEDYDTSENINALYTELKHQTTNDLTTTLNLRFDNIKHNYEDNLDTSNNVSPEYNTLSYRLGVNYILSDNNSLYSNFSTGFRTPTVEQTSTNQVALAADPTLDIPYEIDVEKTYNYELGFRGTNGFLTYDASIYQLDRKIILEELQEVI